MPGIYWLELFKMQFEIIEFWHCGKRLKSGFGRIPEAFQDQPGKML